MTYEFEGKTEREAIDNAVAELELDRDKFDIEVIDSGKSGFLGMGKRVRIRVHLPDAGSVSSSTGNGGNREGGAGRKNNRKRPERTSKRANTRKEGGNEGASSRNAPAQQGFPPENDFEHGIVDFLQSLTEKMGNPATASILYREENKLAVRLDSQNNAMLIGRKGSTLDSIQTLANIVAGRIGGEDTRIIVDSENYRSRREEHLVRLAEKVGDEVKQNGASRLLEPMNPFERRLIHTTLSNVSGISTKSEGDGLYKQVRVFSRD
ncbi:MAG: RNA-binding cell elongation regulator Jag/EloR [Spirochaetota bacterium]